MFPRPMCNVYYVVRMLWEVTLGNANVKKSSMSVTSQKSQCLRLLQLSIDRNTVICAKIEARISIPYATGHFPILFTLLF